MTKVTTAQLGERVAALETELPHLVRATEKASTEALAANAGVTKLNSELSALSTQLSQLREMLKRYLQIGTMLGTAALLQLTGGPIAESAGLFLKALAFGLQKAF